VKILLLIILMYFNEANVCVCNVMCSIINVCNDIIISNVCIIINIIISNINV